jgi:prolyl oligopeptidase
VYVETRHIGLNGVIAVHPDGTSENIRLPFDGADVIGLHSAGNEDGAWLILQSWVQPPVLCEIRSDGLVRSFDTLGAPSSPVSQYIFTVESVTARDGVKVPITLIRRKDAPRDGTVPIIMTAYGAYGTILPTRYTPADIAWLDKGGALAIAHVRGGGEYGEPWHLAGFKTTKPNTWRDVIDCARWLIAQRWTSARRLSIQGKSAGGIAVGRALTEEPRLFGCALLRVSAVNTIRMHKTPVGPANFPEFGNPDDAAEFRNLLEMDSYQHVKPDASYPPVMFTAGMEDGRIPPWQPAKMLARLQEVSCNPAILRIEQKGGHGLGLTRDQENAERADLFAFAWWATHLASPCGNFRTRKGQREPP